MPLNSLMPAVIIPWTFPELVSTVTKSLLSPLLTAVVVVAGACAPVWAMPVFGSAEAAPAEAAANDIHFRKSRRADCLIVVLLLVMRVSLFGSQRSVLRT